MKKTVIAMIVLDVLALFCLFIMYGPISYFRDLLVTTAMTTMNHKYIARVFYDDDTIYKILEANKLIQIDDDSNNDEIDFEDHENPDTEWERQILDREEGQLYKIIEISETNYKGFLVALYDPSRIDLAMTNHLGSSGQYIRTIVRNNNASIGINASGFDNIDGVVTGGYPTGIIIKDGSVIWRGTPTGWPGGLIGFNNENKLVLTYKTPEEAIQDGMKNAVEFGPFLIVNGKSAEVVGTGGYGLAPRTAIGQRRDGIVLLLVIDGRQPGYSLGADMADLIMIFERYNAWNASNLDGGASTALVEGNEYLNYQNYDRAAPNSWIIK